MKITSGYRPVVIGIDPGLHGGLAVCSGGGNLLHVAPMPTHTVLIRGKRREVIDILLLNGFIASWAAYGVHAYIEHVGGMPGQSAHKSFLFGRNTGLVEGMLAAYDIVTTSIAPVVWKRSYGLTSGNKAAARAKAAELFPEHAGAFRRVKDDGPAEAALIALYGAANADDFELGSPS